MPLYRAFCKTSGCDMRSAGEGEKIDRDASHSYSYGQGAIDFNSSPPRAERSQEVCKRLYILPNVFSDEQPTKLLLPEGLKEIVASLTDFIAESERTGRRYLIKLLGKDPIARNLPIHLLNEHSSREEVKTLGEKILRGGTFGLISDAGMPGIADPGSELIHYLRERGEHRIFVVPGPCSIFLALISSGLPGQKFSFHGYLPKEKEERVKKIKKLERESFEDGRTQICIEAPYRNEALLKDFLDILHPETELSLVTHVSFPDESVRAFSVKDWKNKLVEKKPTVFLFFARKKAL